MVDVRSGPSRREARSSVSSWILPASTRS